MDIDELVAREQIRELVADYTHFGDGGRIDELVDLFMADATLDGFRVTYSGEERIRSFFVGIVTDREDDRTEQPARTYVRHHISNVTIEMDGPDQASGASYWVVYADDGFESSGRYRDTYHRDSDGKWRFATRTIRRDRQRSDTNGSS